MTDNMEGPDPMTTATAYEGPPDGDPNTVEPDAEAFEEGPDTADVPATPPDDIGDEPTSDVQDPDANGATS